MRFPSLLSLRAVRSVLISSVALAMLGACGDKPVEPVEDGLDFQAVILRADDGSVTYSHADHWHGAPVVQAGGTRGITIHFSNHQSPADEHEAPPVETWFTLASAPASYEMRAVIEDTTVARWTGDRLGGTLHGLRAGASRISFVVRRGTTTVYEAAPLNFRVQAAP